MTPNWTIAAIHSLRPGAEFVMRGDALEWLDASTTAPTAQEISAEASRLQAAEPLRIAKEARAAAFKAETDPLFFKVQRGEMTHEDWLAKVEEVRQRFPYPEG